MTWQEEYRRKLNTPEEAIRKCVHSGDCIYGGGASVAVATLNALFAAIDEGALDHITLHAHSFCNPGFELEKYSFSPEQLRLPTFFMNPPDREALKNHKAEYMPLQYGMYDRYIEFHHPNVAIVLVSPPDENGYCNIGPFGFTPAAMSCAATIIGQVSKHVPRVNGSAHDYPVSRFAAFVEADDPLALLNNPPTSEIESRIASYILEFIKDGSCIQLGIGGIANAIGFNLKGRKHLGIHTEVLTESIIDLMESGAVDNSRKAFNRGYSTIGFVLGSQRQYDYIDNNKDFMFVPFREVVSIRNIASIDNMISINAAVSVDLTGQVCAESIGRRQYSGTGGQLDFVRGSSLSKGGASFIAMPSVAHTKNGPTSRIVLDLAQGSIVTTPRTDVQYVVTEYGCVNLMFSSVPDRVKKLISIAHPDYRDELVYQAKKAGLLY